MSIKAHRRKKASFKAFSFATYKGWSVFVAKGAAVRLRPSRWNKMAKTGLGLPRGGTSTTSAIGRQWSHAALGHVGARMSISGANIRTMCYRTGFSEQTFVTQMDITLRF